MLPDEDEPFELEKEFLGLEKVELAGVEAEVSPQSPQPDMVSMSRSVNYGLLWVKRSPSIRQCV